MFSYLFYIFYDVDFYGDMKSMILFILFIYLYAYVEYIGNYDIWIFLLILVFIWFGLILF